MDNSKSLKYCPKCGYIEYFSGAMTNCILCNTELFKINPKWEITEEKYDEFMAPEEYGEKTNLECKQDFYNYCMPFYEEVLKKRPEFEQELFEHLVEREQEYWKIRNQRFAEYCAKEKYFEEKYGVGVDSPSHPTVTCPYCHSTNTKKISGVERATSVGLFGLLSKKIGKSWKCNSCGSTW